MTARVTAIQAIRANSCARCGAAFVLGRSDVQYCSNACRQAAYRARPKPPGSIALVVWREVAGTVQASWTMHATRALAAANAPTDRPFSIVNVGAKPWRVFATDRAPYTRREGHDRQAD